jgi:hypothetical protein
VEIFSRRNANMWIRFLDMHMYVTSALQRTDMKAVGLQLALDLLHEKVTRAASGPGCSLFRHPLVNIILSKHVLGSPRSDKQCKINLHCSTFFYQ